MAQEITMKVIDESSLFDEDLLDTSSEDLNSDLIPISMDQIEEDEEDLVAKQVNLDDLRETPSGNNLLPENRITLIESLLKEKGIDNPKEIIFEEEDGSTSTADFYELTPEEQLEILSSSDLETNYGLDDNEIEAINYMRENDVTLSELIEFYQQEALNNYKSSIQGGNYEIDSYTDEELYVLDQKAKFEDLTEDELRHELERVLENPDLFKKKVDKIRIEYKELESKERENVLNDQINQQTQLYEQISNSIIDIANDTEDMYGIILEDQDKEDVVGLITERDINGVNPLVKLLDSPENLFKAAWFLTKGDEAFEILHNYYKKEIEGVRKTSYQKGKDEALKGMPSKPINVIGSPTNSSTRGVKQTQSKYRSIDDLHIID